MSRLASVVLTGPNKTITLPVFNAKLDDPYILIGADGLGPPDIDIPLGESVYRGGVFQGSFAKDREIVLLVNLNQNYKLTPPRSIADMRADFYTLISGPDPITITLNNFPDYLGDLVPATVKTIGYIRRIEVVPFAKEPQVQVTFACPSSYLDAPSAIDLPFVPGLTVDEAFEFDYYGTAIVGFEFSFSITTAPSKIVLRSTANGGAIETLTIPGPRVAGETFAINTSPEGRQVYWTKLGSPSAYGDITGTCTVTTDRWPSVHPGHNVVDLRDGSNVSLPFIPTKFRYTTKYWGI